MKRPAELPLAALLRRLHHARASGDLEVFCGALRGRICVQRGQVATATLGRAEGRSAVRAMVAFRGARYVPAGGAQAAASWSLSLFDSLRERPDDELTDQELDVLCAGPAPLVALGTPAGSAVSRAAPSVPQVAGAGAPPRLGLLALVVGGLVAAAAALAAGHAGVLQLGSSPGASAPAASPVDTAADVLAEPAPLLEPRPRALPIRFERPVRVKGSDTIGAALAPAWAEAFTALHPSAHVAVDAIGSSTAFGGLLDGSADVGASSRRVRAEEQLRARALGITLQEVVVAHDAVAVIVRPGGPLDASDLPTLGQLMVGALGALPGVRGELAVRHLYGRPSYSGTHALFVERVLGKDAHRPLSERFVPLDSPAQIVARVAAERDALGVLSLGRISGAVQVLPLAEAPTSSAPVAPTEDAVRSGQYPLARPLYLYLRGDASAEARAFVDFALSDAGQALVRAQGFVDLGAADGAARVAPPPAGATTPPDVGVERIYFGRGAALLNDRSRATLRALAPTLAAAPVVLVLGNSDGKTGAEGDPELALHRAERVADVLIKLGVPRGAIRIDAEDYPLASHEARGGRSQNRRVDVLYTRR